MYYCTNQPFRLIKCPASSRFSYFNHIMQVYKQGPLESRQIEVRKVVFGIGVNSVFYEYVVWHFVFLLFSSTLATTSIKVVVRGLKSFLMWRNVFWRNGLCTTHRGIQQMIFGKITTAQWTAAHELGQK